MGLGGNALMGLLMILFLDGSDTALLKAPPRDLLGLVDAQQALTRMDADTSEAGLIRLITEGAPAGSADEATLRKAAADLASPNKETRAAAASALRAAGKDALPWLDKVPAGNPDAASLATETRAIIEMKLQAAAAAQRAEADAAFVKKALAIRRLEQMKSQAAAPALERLAKSEDAGLALEATEALRAIHGEPIERVNPKDWFAQVSTRIAMPVGFAGALDVASGAQDISLRSRLAATPQAMKEAVGFRDEQVNGFEDGILKIIAASGNIRLDGLVMLMPPDLGAPQSQSNYIVWIARGQWDKARIERALVPPAEAGGAPTQDAARREAAARVAETMARSRAEGAAMAAVQKFAVEEMAAGRASMDAASKLRDWESALANAKAAGAAAEVVAQAEKEAVAAKAEAAAAAERLAAALKARQDGMMQVEAARRRAAMSASLTSGPRPMPWSILKSDGLTLLTNSGQDAVLCLLDNTTAILAYKERGRTLAPVKEIALALAAPEQKEVPAPMARALALLSQGNRAAVSAVLSDGQRAEMQRQFGGMLDRPPRPNPRPEYAVEMAFCRMAVEATKAEFLSAAISPAGELTAAGEATDPSPLTDAVRMFGQVFGMALTPPPDAPPETLARIKPILDLFADGLGFDARTDGRAVSAKMKGTALPAMLLLMMGR